VALVGVVLPAPVIQGLRVLADRHRRLRQSDGWSRAERLIVLVALDQDGRAGCDVLTLVHLPRWEASHLAVDVGPTAAAVGIDNQISAHRHVVVPGELERERVGGLHVQPDPTGGVLLDADTGITDRRHARVTVQGILPQHHDPVLVIDIE
jgi:hypothetical protein